MRFLRTNTAVIVTVGPFYDKTDGVTIEGSLTITNERITLTADTDAGSAPTNILDNVTGATSGTDNDLNYITGNDAGMMQLELSAANTNRLGRMLLSITDAANHVPVFHEFMVLPAMVYDSLVLGTDRFDANVTHVADTAQTAGDIIGDTNDLQARLPAALTGDGNIKADALRVGGTLQTAGDLAALLDTIDNFLDTEIAAILAAVDTEVAAIVAATTAAAIRAAVGLASANLDTQLDALPTAAEIATALGARTPSAQLGAPTTYDGLIYLIRQGLKNKLKYDKTTDQMVLYEDDGSTAKLTHAMTDDANEATRGASS